MVFNEVKTDTLNLRVSPSFKATLKAVADAEHRSMVNMLEVLLADYCAASRGAIRSDSKAQRQPLHKKRGSPGEPVSIYKSTNTQSRRL